MSKWISVKEKKPSCSRVPDAFGTPVLIWPRNPPLHHEEECNIDGFADGFAYYGRRATGRPAFYLYGAEIHGVTHWQLLPKGPS